MQVGFTFLRSKVGRRILVFFIISAFVPVTAFAILAIPQVVNLYRELNESVLRQANNAYSTALIGRLTGLERELAAFGYVSEENLGRLEASFEGQFESVARLREESLGRSVDGEDRLLPALSAEQSAHLRSGKTALVVDLEGTVASLTMVRALRSDVRGSELLLGRVDSGYLWPDVGSLAEGVHVCVLGQGNVVLYCSAPAMGAALARLQSGNTAGAPGWSRWKLDGTEYLSYASRKSLQDARMLGEWTVVVSETASTTWPSLAGFGSVFVQASILLILIVAFLSVFQIRRSLVPLESLMDGTRRLAEKDFDHQVEVKSGDEFESLAASFNSMASQLNRQFHVLTTMADIDRRILSTVKLEDILRIVLTRMSDVVPCDLVCMTLVESREAEGATGRTYALPEGAGEPTAVHDFELAPSDIRALLSHPTHVMSTGIRGIPHYLAAPVNMGARLILALPIAIKGSLAALISLGYREKRELSKADLAQARDFAHHVGVALSNAAWEERLYFQAHFDNLTGLPNRQLLTDRLQQALARADRLGGYVAVMFLDLDRFKGVNDSLGHAAGDKLLQETAKRLQHAVRSEDTVARLGGDEFVVVIPYLVKDQLAVATVTSIANKILSAISEPMVIEGMEVFVTGSIGIAFATGGIGSVEELLKNADSAMYHAKAQGKADYRFFSQALNAEAVRRSELEYRLHHAIENREFQLHYQPKVELISGRIVGAEALLRWPDPKHEWVEPDEFVPLAEETGLITEIGAWVLTTACRQLLEWTQQGLPPIKVSVNISPVQFRRSNLVKMLGNVLKRSGVDPGRLVLEVTEGTAMEDLERTMVTLQRVRELGVSVAIDNFGTGYSSMRYLKQFPVSTLKIDRSFVRNLTVDTRDAAIVTSGIVLGHSLGMSVVAEGVETKEQLKFLRNAQCEQAQGFLFSRPRPAADFTRLLALGKPYAVDFDSKARATSGG